MDLLQLLFHSELVVLVMGFLRLPGYKGMLEKGWVLERKGGGGLGWGLGGK